MNIFKKIMADQAKAERSLGNPLDADASERRLNFFSTITGGRGFRVPPASSNGKRAGKKAAARERAERQFRKEYEIGVDPIFSHGINLNRKSLSADWKRRSKAWDEANA